ncbi:hypothetical protein V8E36_003744 [Tilletia maclaganii]
MSSLSGPTFGPSPYDKTSFHPPMIYPNWDKPIYIPAPPPQQFLMSEDILRRLLDARPEKKDDDPLGFALLSFRVGDGSPSGI